MVTHLKLYRVVNVSPFFWNRRYVTESVLGVLSQYPKYSKPSMGICCTLCGINHTIWSMYTQFKFYKWTNFWIGPGSLLHHNFCKNGILLPKLFWPTVRKKCSSDREKILKFETEGWEFGKFLRSLEQFIQTVKG